MSPPRPLAPALAVAVALVLSASALLAVPASAATPSPPGALELPAPSTYTPATVTDAVGSDSITAFRVRYAPGAVDVTALTSGGRRRPAVTGIAGRLRVAGSNLAVPYSTTGGAEPDRVDLLHGADGTEDDLSLLPGQRYLTAAGAGVLVALPAVTGWSLVVRTAGAADQAVGQLPDGTFGAVAADVSGALVGFTPTGTSTPSIDYVDLAGGTVTPIQTTPLTGSAPLVALSGQVLAWTDGTDLVRVPRPGGPESRRALGATPTALAVLDASSGWISEGHLLTGPADPAAASLDHGQVLAPGALFAAAASYHAITGTIRANASTFTADQAAATGASDLGAAYARLDGLRLGPGFVARHDTSNPRGQTTTFTRQGSSLASALSAEGADVSGGRRLWDVSGRFRALGNSTDTAVTVTAPPFANPEPPLPDLTVPVATGVDTIDLSGSRLLVHRPEQSRSQLYTVGSSAVASYPLDAQVGGATLAWQDPDGSVKAQDLSTGGPVTLLRPAGAPATCPACSTPVPATLQVAGDRVFWSWYGENRVASLSGRATLTLPDGDLTRSRLSSRVLAAVDPGSSVLSVTDLLDPALTRYPIADAPVAFDVDDEVVTWGDSSYSTHLAVLPVPAVPAARLTWSSSPSRTLVPPPLTSGQATLWYHHADVSQPVQPVLTIRNSAGAQVFQTSYGTGDTGSFDVDWDGHLTPTSPSAPPAYAPAGSYRWTVEAQDVASHQVVVTESGALDVRDARTVSLAVGSRPTALVYGTARTLTAHVVLSSLGKTVGVPGVTVQLQYRAHGTTAWRTLTSKLSAGGSSPGLLQFPLAPIANTDYRLNALNGSYGPRGSYTGPLLTTVATRVTAALSATRVRAGSTVAVSGTVAPRHPGQAVVLQRLLSGTWRTVTSVRLSTTSAYRFTFRPARGTSTYRVVKPADADHVTGVSPTLGLSAS